MSWTDIPEEPKEPGRYVVTLYLTEDWRVLDWCGDGWRDEAGRILPVTGFWGPVPFPS